MECGLPQNLGTLDAERIAISSRRGRRNEDCTNRVLACPTAAHSPVYATACSWTFTAQPAIPLPLKLVPLAPDLDLPQLLMAPWIWSRGNPCGLDLAKDEFDIPELECLVESNKND